MKPKPGIELIEEGFFEEIDRDELDRTMQQIREERFFQREFAKDLKRFQKADEALHKKKKKNDLIDSFIEGELKLNDVLTKLNESKAASRHAAAVRDNKRISQMFRKSRGKSGAHSPRKAAQPKHNETGLFTLKDFINDAESEVTS